MKIDILFGILITLLDKTFVTAKFLADKFCISTRTVYRYLSILDSCEVPIETKTGKNGGIRILNTYKLNSIYFSNSEKQILKNLVENYNLDDVEKNLLLTKIDNIK